MKETVTILSAGNSLGVYVPAKLLQLQLRDQGVPADIFMLEHMYDQQTRENIPRYRKAFHDSFTVAKMGYKMAKDSRNSLDENNVATLLHEWKLKGRRRFLALTGFWIPILQRYQEIMASVDLDIRLIRLDASDTPSFSVYGEACDQFKNVWLYPVGENRIIQTIAVSQEEPVPFQEREKRYLIHGGGWGIGTYKDKITELTDSDIALNIIAYYNEDIAYESHKFAFHRYFMMDPSWSPWQRNAVDEFDFPPFAEVSQGEASVFESGGSYPKVFELIRHSLGIISKPGGATLLDSLASATPLIFLEPFGDHERSNAQLWESLGLGISYDAWKEQDYAVNVLEDIHRNLCNAKHKAGNLMSDIT
ncbi:hypothetical protein GK047_10265 [Paenibacillus sp. SYP-B3998]|uniref:UDP-glucuronosyltransferase n=1 Tax=Paenibacillus sp. SYP-B3998 TaxID=2678564 RepID=A0A6G3ZXG4_9BACL|nr:hypothetical protein [Paenibacillus sp. SYP-B3998]NEW06394.1 hypothetical protein [Paenibacillus sp. SYP-B3998]